MCFVGIRFDGFQAFCCDTLLRMKSCVPPHLADDSAYENTCDARTPSPAFTCTVDGAKATPSCDTHKQPTPPVHEHHTGPWNGEVEAKSWSLASGANAP